MEARFYSHLRDDTVQCDLCPHRCIIMSGRSGTCRVRTNRNGKLFADTYGSLSATHFDPIEKKPLYHFHPGSEIFSLGSLGCNFRCPCCQNYEISQSGKPGFPRLQEMDIEKVLKTAGSNPANIGIAYTYNEPFVWYEFMFDIAKRVKEMGLLNVVVSNGYINPEPLEELIPYIDAFNIDLKAFDVRGYKEFTGGELPYVLHTLGTIAKHEKHLEITMLVVPGLNDDMGQFESMVQWIRDRLGKSTPLHLSRYFPHYKMDTEPTRLDLMVSMAEKAKEQLDHVYLGNVPGSEFQDTYCPSCGGLVVRRRGYTTQLTGLAADGTCKDCRHPVVIA